MLEQIIDVFEVNTDAIATNRGFYYQYLTILKKWIVNFIEDNDIDAYSEVDQDIKEVGESLMFTQVKCYTSNFSLNSEEVKNTIFNFFILYQKNKEFSGDSTFCFSTNTSISNREKLLSKWINDENLSDENLRKLCNDKVKEILIKEIKNRKNKKLNQKKSDEKQNLIKLSATKLIEIVNNEVDTFTRKIKWKFENLSPEDAIVKLKIEIENLLENNKFQNRPVSLLFGVFISEIYKRSQEKDSENRSLTNKKIINLLSHSDTELEEYLNVKFFRLINIELDLLRTDLKDIQSKIENHTNQIDLLNKSFKKSKNNEVPKFLNLLPDFTSINIYDWETFVKEVNSQLASTKLVSVFSQGGMGKTSFAKKYLQTYSNYKHLIWITVENSLSHSFALDEVLIKNLNLDFSSKDEVECRFVTILNELNKIEGKNLIVVDIQEFEEDKAALNKFLSLTHWEKLILSRNKIKTIPFVKLPQVSIQNCKNIFNSYISKQRESDSSILTEFIEYVDFNILVIELVAKTIENRFDLTLEYLFKSLKNQDLDDDEYKIDIDILDENDSIKIFNYLIKKFSFENLSQHEKGYLEFLSILPSRDIIIEDIILINGLDFYKENKVHIVNLLISLDRKGLVEFSDDKQRINIHKIIKEVLLYNQRKTTSPFFGNLFYITWLTVRIKEGQNNPAVSFRYLRYAQSILSSIKEEYRNAVYQPLIMLENELLYSYRFYFNSENDLNLWIDLASRAEKYPMLDKINLGVIYVNLGLAYSYTDSNKAIEQFKKALGLFKQNEIKFKNEIIITLNNISNTYLKSKDVDKALENFKNIQKFRKKHSLYDDQQLVIEYRIIADSYKICGDIKSAIKYMSEGIKLHYTLDQVKRNDFYLSACYNYLFQLYLLDNNFDFAIIQQENAVKTLENMKLENSEYLLFMYQILLHLFKHKGYIEKVEEINLKINSFKSINYVD